MDVIALVCGREYSKSLVIYLCVYDPTVSLRENVAKTPVTVFDRYAMRPDRDVGIGTYMSLYLRRLPRWV